MTQQKLYLYFVFIQKQTNPGTGTIKSGCTIWPPATTKIQHRTRLVIRDTTQDKAVGADHTSARKISLKCETSCAIKHDRTSQGTSRSRILQVQVKANQNPSRGKSEGLIVRAQKEDKARHDGGSNPRRLLDRQQTRSLRHRRSACGAGSVE